MKTIFCLCDFSSAFNTTVLEMLWIKLSQLSVPNPTWRCVVDFLTNRRQQVQQGKHTLDSWTLSAGVPHSCVLSPLLFSLYTNEYVSKEPAEGCTMWWASLSMAQPPLTSISPLNTNSSVFSTRESFRDLSWEGHRVSKA